jgi:cation:H+ antiporter
MDEVVWFILSFPVLALGIIALVKGSDTFIGGAASLAKSIGVSEHIIGITLVAFATSLPELLVCTMASYKGEGSMALGNVLGSNVANIGLVLGTSILLMSIIVKREAKRDAFIMCGITLLLLLLMGYDGQLTRGDGMFLVFIYILYFIYLAKTREHMPVVISHRKTLRKDTLLVIVGCTSLLVGSEFLIRSAVFIAMSFGVSTLIIGLTIVAVGTSLPELASSVAAALKGSYGIAAGNVIGSNIINITLALGAASIVRTIPVAADVKSIIMPMVLLFSGLMLVMTLKSKIHKFEGAVILGLYALFIIILF